MKVDSVAHVRAVFVRKGMVGGAVDAYVEQSRHETGDVLWHGTSEGEDEGALGVAEFALRHYLKVVDGLPQKRLKVVAVVSLGGENAEVGDSVALLGEFE